MNLYARLRSDRPVPVEHRSTFRHLYLDITWFGLLAASTLGFTNVYAARLGATAAQLGLLSMGPGLANLLFALPAGRWLARQPIGAAVFWMGVFHRAFYLLWIALPWLLPGPSQVWALIGVTMIMHVPGSALAVGFNALFAEVVPVRWRGHVAGTRNALLALMYIVLSLVCGWILTRVQFPIGYQVVFALGFVGGALSTLHLWHLVPCAGASGPPGTGRGLRALCWPDLRSLVRRLIQARATQGGLGVIRTDVLRGKFGGLIAVLFALHLTLYLAVPLFSLYWVNDLKLNDSQIGLGTAVFYASMFLGSTRLSAAVARLGNQRVTALGAVFIASYPAFMAAARGLPLFLVGSAAGGLGWSLTGGAMINYILEKVPENDRPPYLAWFTLAVNGALLVGSLAGPFFAGQIGVRAALVTFAGLRLLAAAAVWLWE